jgi:4-oxalocrotonate tautomerase
VADRFKGVSLRPEIQLSEATVPYVNIKITREGATSAQKAELIAGVTELLQRVLNKNPATTVVVIDEVDLDNWGIGGLPVEDFRRRNAR